MTRHALQRARERYDRALDEGDMLALNAAIRSGAVPARGRARRDGSSEVYLVPHAGRRFRVIWSIPQQRILTLLPLKGGGRDRKRTVYREGRKYFV